MFNTVIDAKNRFALSAQLHGKVRFRGGLMSQMEEVTRVRRAVMLKLSVSNDNGDEAV